MQGIEAVGASENARGWRAGVRAQGSDGDVDGFIVTASESAADKVDDGAPGLVADIFGDRFEAVGDDPRSERFGLGHSVQSR